MDVVSWISSSVHKHDSLEIDASRKQARQNQIDVAEAGQVNFEVAENVNSAPADHETIDAQLASLEAEMQRGIQLKASSDSSSRSRSDRDVP